jgi:hypothetical protein
MGKFFNHYSLVARVYPAMLSFAPALWTAVVLVPALISDVWNGTVSLLAIGCILYLLASLARSRGKVLEGNLLAAWGGWPTTILLRHGDPTIDPITKARYHRALAAIMGRASLPTAKEEESAPIEADHIYRSATKQLIETRRAPTFRMLADENASYGFRRNLLGLKWVTVGIALLALGATGQIWWWHVTQPVDFNAIVSAARAHVALPVLLTVDVCYATIFIFMIRRRFVRQAADEYALALFRTLDLK